MIDENAIHTPDAAITPPVCCSAPHFSFRKPIDLIAHYLNDQWPETMRNASLTHATCWHCNPGLPAKRNDM